MPDVYQMTAHIFGAKDSPSCAAYALRKTALDNKETFSTECVKSVLQSFYVDDLLKSVKDETEAISLARELIEMLKKGGFLLTKFISNSRKVLEALPKAVLAKPELDPSLETLPTERVLGIRWNVGRDDVVFNTLQKEAPVTKRGILQVVSPIFDPLGFLAPYNIKAQILLQRLWRMQYGWDDEIVEESKRIWNSWLDELKSISSFALPRRYTNGEEHIVNNQLEIFFDSSEQAFGAVAYPSCIHQTGTRTCSFVMAKTHLAPLKALTIVRLELQAATLAVRLYNTIKNEMDIKVSTVRFWTDSKITLQYIRNQIKRLKTFVTNRVAEIHENSDPRCWFHIDGKENPADDCTRGLHFKGLRWQPMALRFRILTQRGRECQFEGKSN